MSPAVPASAGRIQARDCGTWRRTHYQTQRKDDAGWFVIGEYDSIVDARQAITNRNEPFISRIVRVITVITHEVTW